MSTGPGQAPRAALLLVEDDEILARLLAEILRETADVRWASTAEEGAELVGTARWDLVVADIELPGMSGIELVRRAKAAHAALATLVLSGRSGFEDAVQAIRAGADDYLTKPVEPAALVEKVRELVARTRERRAAGREVVLAVGAHPDDVEIGCGGILLRHAAAGDDVSILTLTGGEAGGVAADRAEESRVAAELMSARLVHADLQDTSVGDGGVTIGVITRVIDDVRPTTIYTHTPRDVHQDHRTVHSATLVAARGLPRIFCYQSPSTTVEFRPTRFVSIDDVMDRKLEVIRAFSSQVSIRRYLDEELLRATARYWSRFAQSRYVEPLEVMRDSEGSAAPAAEAAGVA